ncbi:hypothetical protein EVAR_2779_1 [Eumeta japonica]|uniref:Uncharacterized protein n=1 Tax=Eumeta variegata TaxID=151549 RepID=A0A4C1T288_EUMVA|nr:hypothetical protein EVAR_2779_1 [Eumeta japonica]
MRCSVVGGRGAASLVSRRICSISGGGDRNSRRPPPPLPAWERRAATARALIPILELCISYDKLKEFFANCKRCGTRVRVGVVPVLYAGVRRRDLRPQSRRRHCSTGPPVAPCYERFPIPLRLERCRLLPFTTAFNKPFRVDERSARRDAALVEWRSSSGNILHMIRGGGRAKGKGRGRSSAVVPTSGIQIRRRDEAQGGTPAAPGRRGPSDTIATTERFFTYYSPLCAI